MVLLIQTLAPLGKFLTSPNYACEAKLKLYNGTSRLREKAFNKVVS